MITYLTAAVYTCNDVMIPNMILFCRYQPSQADSVVFDALSGPPPADLENALRWYNHIKSYGAARSS